MNTLRVIALVILISSSFAQDCCDSNVIKVSGNAEVKVKPDYATIEIGAEATAKTTSQALSNLNKKIDQLISIIKAQGISSKDYSTSSLTLSQVYETINEESVLTGQKASQTKLLVINDSFTSYFRKWT